ncbi:hypothetical protein FHL15_009654 [Xylaria flabelliformis]|uniref:Uncharacterized protein n=1 Tax=Xylaria flabelliformis TaxID=2512241 RepID=A0A553HNE6_9PEZI|nr:hypothetical protein FHL15_009654 [Xylaria flabelliformis]
MPPRLLEGRDPPATKPIRPQLHHTHKALVHYTPLPKKPPRKLDLDKCQNCREAKKKIIPSSNLAVGAIPVMTSTSTESSLKLNQLKAKPCLACLALGLSILVRHPARTVFMQGTVMFCAPAFPNMPDLSGMLLDFNVTWTLRSIMGDITEFIRPAATKPTSKVGVLCSPNFVGLIQNYISHGAASLFQSMLYGMSFSYVHSLRTMDTISVPMLQSLGAQAGHQILRYLNIELKPQQLSKSSLEKRQVLFLLVFGAILAIRYARRADMSQDLLTTNTMSEELWETMRGHLCEMLAHHLVLLGASVGISLSKTEEERVLRLPAITWDRKGTHAWKIDEKHSSNTSFVHRPRHQIHGTELPHHERPCLPIDHGDKERQLLLGFCGSTSRVGGTGSSCSVVRLRDRISKDGMERGIGSTEGIYPHGTLK